MACEVHNYRCANTLEFLKDKHHQPLLAKRGIRTWEHEELLLRFIPYVNNIDLRIVKGISERRKGKMFGDPTDGTLYREETPHPQ
jgi:hypothetical protein